MRRFRRWLGTPARLLTLRFFNVLAEGNALEGMKEQSAEPGNSLCASDNQLAIYRLLTRLKSSRSEDVFGVMDTTM